MRQRYIKILSALLLTALLIQASSAQYNDLGTVDFPENVIDIQYSAHHHFVGVGSPSELRILHGYTSALIQTIEIPENIRLSSFAFSEDESLLILGINDGGANLFSYDQGAKNFVDTGK